MPKTQEIVTRIVLRNDILSNWEISTIILDKGEPAVELNLENLTSKIKIGDGVHTFNELPYSTITPDEIQKMINDSIAGLGGGGGSIYSVNLTSGTKNGTLKLIINNIEYDNIAVTGLGSAAYTDSSEYATAQQGKRADTAMVYKGLIASLPNGMEVGDTYSVSTEFTIPASVSDTNKDINVVIGDKIIATPEGKWTVMPAGVSDVAKSLTQGISANLTGGVTGNASAANAGETLEINVTSVNTDYLTPGNKVIILNGGNALT